MTDHIHTVANRLAWTIVTLTVIGLSALVGNLIALAVIGIRALQ